jgi:hypothetical protein
MKAASVKTAAAKPTTHLPLEEISDILDHLPFKACAELTRRLLTSISSLSVILFVAEYGRTP